MKLMEEKLKFFFSLMLTIFENNLQFFPYLPILKISLCKE